jgi:hypothetical protein
MLQKKKGEALLVTGHGNQYGCETSRLAPILYNRLTDGGEVANLTRRPFSVPRRVSGNHFKRLCRLLRHCEAGRTRSIEQYDDLVGNLTRNLPACNIVSQPTTLPRDLMCK